MTSHFGCPDDYDKPYYNEDEFIMATLMRTLHGLAISWPVFIAFFMTIKSFNKWGRGRGCHNFFSVLEGDGTKIDSTGDLFDQPPGEMI